MPLGKYYCDYCDKQFQDTPAARKRHLQGLQHLRAKALWFDSLPESNQTFGEGYSKGVCNRFIKTGFCQYGDSCKYVHPKNTVNSSTQFLADNQHPTVITGNQLVGGASFQAVMVKDSAGMTWGNLPPSLQPPPEGGCPPLPVVDWG